MHVLPLDTEMPEAARDAARTMNQLGALGRPFVFLIDFELEHPLVIPLEEAADAGIFFSCGGMSNWQGLSAGERGAHSALQVAEDASGRDRYQRAFDAMRKHLLRGDIYLANLTHRVPIRTNQSLAQIYEEVSAPYKIIMRGQFVVFSPESFVTIRNGNILTFPMKGTIPMEAPNSVELLLGNPKEIAEHATVVDLLRNDLSMVARDVAVERYRYVQTIETDRGKLLQTSSEIRGVLPENYREILGNIIFNLLPAGSISGAPKSQAVKIIRTVESGRRGYYTGVFGIFDGSELDSAVLIRFIEQSGDALYFRSGGGITINSECEREYQELLEKVVLPREARG